MKKAKKLLAIMLAGAMLLGFTACGEKSGGDDNWKIGVITGTVSQNEEEYRAAENVVKKYGKEHVITQTYPDKFTDEQETLIANVTGVASDENVKALIICQSVPGMSAAIDKVKETRGDDLLILAGVPGEDPPMISKRADICMAADEIQMGNTIPEQAKKQGAKTLIHYSFPRHMSYATLSQRREIMKKKCKEVGLKFVDATAPDPTGDAGESGAKQFILEDVPKMVAKYGKDTAFFSTNCAMQEPLIKSALDEGAIYPQPCCPSPFHGFPAALGLEISEENKGNVKHVVDATKEAVAKKDGTGRFSTWVVPVNMMFVEAGADYAVNWIKDGAQAENKVDYDKLNECFKAYAKDIVGEDVEITMSAYKEKGTTYENYKFVLCPYLNY